MTNHRVVTQVHLTIAIKRLWTITHLETITIIAMVILSRDYQSQKITNNSNSSHIIKVLDFKMVVTGHLLIKPIRWLAVSLIDYQILIIAIIIIWVKAQINWQQQVVIIKQ